VLGGLGLGCVTPEIFVAAQLSVSGELIAVGTGLVAAARSLGGLVGLVVNNAIFNNAVQKNVPTKIAAAVLPLCLAPSYLANFITALTSGNTQAIAAIPGVTPEIIGVAARALRQAYSMAFRNVWIAAACFSIPGVVSKSTCPDYRIRCWKLTLSSCMFPTQSHRSVQCPHRCTSRGRIGQTTS
jgi:hypothetical protein